MYIHVMYLRLTNFQIVDGLWAGANWWRTEGPVTHQCLVGGGTATGAFCFSVHFREKEGGVVRVLALGSAGWQRHWQARRDPRFLAAQGSGGGSAAPPALKGAISCSPRTH